MRRVRSKFTLVEEAVRFAVARIAQARRTSLPRRRLRGGRRGWGRGSVWSALPSSGRKMARSDGGSVWSALPPSGKKMARSDHGSVWSALPSSGKKMARSVREKVPKSGDIGPAGVR